MIKRKSEKMKKKVKTAMFRSHTASDTISQFTLPKHVLSEECVEEYTESIDAEGNVIREDISPTVEDMETSKYNHTTSEGLNFSNKVDFKSHVHTVKSKTIYGADGRKKIFMKASKTAWVHNLLYLNGEKFDFTGREYLFPIYNTPHKEILLKTGRQVEKTVSIYSSILMSNGEYKIAKDISLGDKISQLNPKNQKIVSGDIIWKSRIYKKRCCEITTRIGHKMTIAYTHPVRTWNNWTEASKLSVGDRVATVRKAGEFANDLTYKKIEIELLGGLLGNGYLHSKSHTEFTNRSGLVLERYKECLRLLSIEYKEEIYPCKKEHKDYSTYGRIRSKTPPIIEKEGLIGHKSRAKFIPSFVFSLSRKNTALFINSLWSTDGHTKQNTTSKYSLEYSSSSKKMIYQLQTLLWKFSIPSKIRENLPNIYKKRGELDKVAYILRIETQPGVKIFLTQIGALGKIEKLSLPNSSENNNRDTFPKEITSLIQKIDRSDMIKDKRGTKYKSLYSSGLRLTPKYAPSQNKIKEYLSYFKGAGNKDSDLIKELQGHSEGDVYWDKITSIKDLGEIECVDFTATEHHNYIVSGIITHNSTMLANNLAIMCAMIPFFRCMYVSPSHVQTRTFSNDKLKPLLERSPMIAKYLQDNKVSTQVFEKGYTNGSMIFLRSAFFSADRARGISSDCLTIDELQDMIMSNIPVIAQCLSHSKYQFHIYAGTPKTFDNTIEQFWDNSTQGEWMVPCTHCSSTLGKKWNFLDLSNIGKHGPICKHCGADLQVNTGQWQFADSTARMKGFRIPQLMVPWIAKKGGEPWKTLVHEMETYPESQFYNEVLGLSFDNAAKPITRADLMMNCDAKKPFIKNLGALADDVSRMTLFAGIDWGEGHDGTGKDVMGKIRNASYTIMTIGGYIGQKFRIVYAKKYRGKEIDPNYIIQDVVATCTKLKVRMIGVDWGHGWGVNNQLFRKYGTNRCVQFMHVDNQKEVRKWDPIGFKFQLMRNHVMSEIFFQLKEGMFLFPKWEEWEWYAQDILNISVEYVEYQRKLRYIHRPSDPDDCFHSLLYCKQAAEIYHGKQ